MACHSHCNQCSTHPGYVGPATPVSWYDDPVDTDDPVYDHHFNQLRSEIQEELTRRSLSENTWVDDPGTVNTDDVIYKDHYRYVRNQIYKSNSNNWWTNYPTDTVLSGGQPILADSTNNMRDATDALKAQCVCNCNYSCTCNCNYCVCNCNYACQCNCNYGGSGCTCNCNYSDGT